MLIIISEKASTTNIQYVHLRAVCKPWRKALTPNPRHLPRQTPWLLLPIYVLSRVGIDDFHISFYDLSQSRTHRFELPKVSSFYINGSYYGWLVIVRDNRVLLHNPITRKFIELPSLDAPLTCYVKKVLLSCNPSEQIRGCVVVAGLLYPKTSKWELSFCRIGDTHWTEVKMRDKNQSLLDFINDNNSVYMVNIELEVFAYDLESLAVRTFPSKINCNCMYACIKLVKGDDEADSPLVVITTEFLEKLKHIYVYKWINYEQQ